MPDDLPRVWFHGPPRGSVRVDLEYFSDGRQAHVHLSFLDFSSFLHGGGAYIPLNRLIGSLAGHKAVNGYGYRTFAPRQLSRKKCS